MTSVRTKGRLFLSLAVAAVALAGCATPPPPPPPAPRPPPPPAPVALNLSAQVIQAAAAYEGYIARVAAMKPDFKSGQDVADELQAGASYDPAVMSRGEIAFAAIAALQAQPFVTELRNFSIDPAGRAELVRSIAADPNYVTAFKSAPTAFEAAETALTAQGHDLEVAGETIRLSAYDIQHQAWSREFVANRDARLALARTNSTNTPQASVDETDQMRQAAADAAPLPMPVAPESAASAPTAAEPATAAYPPAIVRGVAIAALALLGAAGDEDAALTAPLMIDPPDQSCLSLAKLNLYQCLAVAKPHYEDVFCLGQHAMKDTGQCLRIAAGAPQPTVAPIPPTQSELAKAEKGKKGRKKHKAAG